jgi:hypothetical protein
LRVRKHYRIDWLGHLVLDSSYGKNTELGWGIVKIQNPNPYKFCNFYLEPQINGENGNKLYYRIVNMKYIINYIWTNKVNIN